MEATGETLRESVRGMVMGCYGIGDGEVDERAMTRATELVERRWDGEGWYRVAWPGTLVSPVTSDVFCGYPGDLGAEAYWWFAVPKCEWVAAVRITDPGKIAELEAHFWD